VRKLAEDRDQNFIIGGQSVRDRGLPASRPGGREDENLALLGLEGLLQILKERQRELREVRRALVLERNIHGLTDRKRHVGRAGDEETLKS